MSVIGLVNQAVAWYAASAVLAFLFAMRKPLSGAIAGIGGAVASAMLVVAGGAALLMPERIHGGMLQFLHLTIRVGGVNALWLLAIGLSALPVSLFNISWHRHPQVKANGPLVNLLLAAATCAVVVTNIGSLVVMAEIMALCAAFLTGCAASGKLWFALGRLGTLLMAWTCWLVWSTYGTLELAQINLQAADMMQNPLLWLPGLVGFALLAGAIPLHGWAPQAHAGASAPAAALFSTVVMKVGLYGMLTVSLAGGVPPLWWGVMLLALGMITAFIGGLYALMEHNIQRLLAYHTLENIGIILLGLGAFVTGVATRNSTLMVLGFIGGMYHLINHSLFKTTLFLGAGAVWFRTGHRDIEKLGGIGKKMPLISLAMLVGLMAMAALPPLNGFAGEWVIYQSFFKMSTGDLFIGRLLGPLLAVGLAITGALAVMCMAKVYGVTFLGAPRTKEAENATCAPWLMTLSVVLAAVFCLVGGIAAPWLLPLVSGAFPVQAQVSSVVSQPMIALLLIACPLLPFLLMIFFKGDRLAARSRGAAWVCGYDHEQSMVVTAHGFAMPVKEAFAPLLKLRHWLNPVRLVPGWQSASAPALLRGIALVELAVLVVIVISQGA
ncbi:TPA: formate hydrogenlyase subunit 3 [Klebsiella pneumoniae]|uniref:formate hydrogenlyase subunit 3 n=1 Tax=Klebsiella pneumoniae TaxID=573 RepID=UPI0011586FBD|nr:formate hydrogenlyase subunit 3 [Klebsiella pneumoniae]CAF9504780.1 Hydrogenase-4 component B [Klebsiella pneumoniae]CAH5993896.1 Hydrogenase-4 component B [Klebsiella pneumoniae]HBQ5856355.1 formate hydrogenlyase subunit 3 [Klebsiella pneumoniae subsp. pneumoniae]HBR3474951.1 formate hydrogenlyase subunit 3 [Klebsiella pneumoniae]